MWCMKFNVHTVNQPDISKYTSQTIEKKEGRSSKATFKYDKEEGERARERQSVCMYVSLCVCH